MQMRMLMNQERKPGEECCACEGAVRAARAGCDFFFFEFMDSLRVWSTYPIHSGLELLFIVTTGATAPLPLFIIQYHPCLWLSSERAALVTAQRSIDSSPMFPDPGHVRYRHIFIRISKFSMVNCFTVKSRLRLRPLSNHRSSSWCPRGARGA